MQFIPIFHFQMQQANQGPHWIAIRDLCIYKHNLQTPNEVLGTKSQIDNWLL